MKKIVCLLMVSLLLLSFAACADVSSGTPQESSSPDPVVSTPDGVMDEEGDLGDYHIKIVSASVSEDYEGNSALVVTYEWTNNSDEEQMFSTAFSAKAYQNGVECTSAFLVDGVDAEKSLTNIKPGATLEVQEAYELTDTSNVEVEVTEWISFSDDKVVKTFTLE